MNREVEDTNQKPLVSICTLVYNQEAFLSNYFEGVLSQQTNFLYEILIHDDASTDNSAEIIRDYQSRYPHLIKAIIQEENKYSQGVDINLTYNFPRVQGKYIALCEGDDYWTDPLKLQKQVDFLETHPTYNLYCHNWEVLNETKVSPSPVHHLYQKPFSFTFATLPWVWITKTMTLLFRHNIFDYNLLRRYEYSRDVHLVYHLLINGKGYFNPDVMSRYRIHGQGIWGGSEVDVKNETTYELYKELYAFEKNKAVRKRYLNATLALFNGKLYQKQSIKQFFQHFSLYAEAWRHVRDIKDLFFCIGGLIPTRFIHYIMRVFKI